MPPRKGIVKSGNAGNSSKAATAAPPPDPNKPPPLFPPGFKYPLSLLQERCQKLSWEKPVVDTRQGPKGHSFVVTLSRYKANVKESVRMEPHPPYFRPSALEARHWGATYALYRFCNGIQLNLVLPPGPKEYWNQLAAERQSVPEHQKWMYYADPFEAKQEVEGRQAKAKRLAESTTVEVSQIQSRKPETKVASNHPEVVMASSLRELVENAIKDGFELYPDASDASPFTLTDDVVPQLQNQLNLLGFEKPQIRDAIAFLSKESILTSSLLNASSPLEACIEYLILHLPECDLPPRFLPTTNSSNPFIVAGHSGETDLKRRWVEEKAVKKAGWPESAVKAFTEDKRFVDKWDLLNVALGQKLIGQSIVDPAAAAPGSTFYAIDQDEYEALGATLDEPGHLVLPLFSAPISVHILFSAEEMYPRPGYIPMYITSTTVPGYVRLHLLSQFLKEIGMTPELDAGEGFCMAAMRIIEGAWAIIEDNGNPDMGAVLENIVPRPAKAVRAEVEEPVDTGASVSQRSRHPRFRKAMEKDEDIKHAFESITKQEKYKEILRSRSRLPAFDSREDFLNKLEKNRVVIVIGETGCGKTTQLPQFILDSLILSSRGSKASILVTQPRRLSAISVANRVSDERLNDGSVGYSIRGESKITKSTRLLFCTTGVVLRRMSTGDDLQDVSHVVVDEVHERSIDGDFLLLELKELLKRHRHLKVILMSATINHETFVNYFNGAPLLTIPGFTHPVTDKYLEDVITATGYRPSAVRATKGDTAKGLREEYEADGLSADVATSIQTLVRSGRIDYQLIATLVNHITKTATTRGGILIFLPGVSEIRQCMDAIRSGIQGKDVTILPLHANLSNAEQRRVFEHTKSWKVIAATNVAETSITIDDVIYVIDAGKVKETQFDPETNMSRLVETWVTRAAARQRRGRAGRTQPGVCYKLYTRKQEKGMIEFPVPEILRVPLESISLTVKSTKPEQDVKTFLGQAIDAPSLASMDRAWTTLQELGAVDDEDNLTALGKHIAMLPMDVRLAKMLILATIFQCLGPILTVVALLSSKPLFVSPSEKRDEAQAARAKFSTGDSDLLTDVKAFEECQRMSKEGQGQSKIRKFCDENFISQSTLRDIITLRQDFTSLLSEMGFIPPGADPSSPTLNTHSTKLNLVKSVIVGGLWPRIARVHLPKGAIKFDKVSAGTVQRDNLAKDYKIFDLREGRVFLHPGSVLFQESTWKPPFLVYFLKHETSKVFLRDASKVPIYALLLFGGPVSVNHIQGGLTVGNKESFVKLQAIPRIGILVNQLRRLLDAQLQKSIEDGTMLTARPGNPIIDAIMALLANDGMSE